MLSKLKELLAIGTFTQGLWFNGHQAHLTTSRPSTSLTGAIIDEELSSYMTGVVENWGVKGLSLAVVRSDREVEYGSWGIGSEDGKKVTPITTFGLASCSKAFTATALGILIDDYASGRNQTSLPSGISSLTWTSKLKDILPNEWQLQDPIATDYTNLQDILSHISGLPGHDLAYGPGGNDSAAEIVARLKYLRPTMEFREGFQYNNLMYTTVAHVVEKYSGISLPDFVQSRIFDKLGMHFSTYSASSAELTGHFSQVWSSNGRRIPYWIPDDTLPFNAGPGGLYQMSSIWYGCFLICFQLFELLARWVQLWLDRGVDTRKNVAIISESSYNAITTATSLSAGKSEHETSIVGYGKGWGRFTYQGIEVVTHSGGDPGINSRVAFLPGEAFGLALLMNVDGVDDRSIMNRVIEHAFDLGIRSPDPERKPEWLDYDPNPPTNRTITFPLSYYAGTYSHPGYGTFSLCASDWPQLNDDYCQTVLASFQTIDATKNSSGLTSQQTPPQLLGAWPRFFSSHLRLYHHDRNTFTMSIFPPNLFLKGYGRDTTPFQMTGPLGQELYIQFSFKDNRVSGFGIFEDLGEAIQHEKAGDRIQDCAYAWFARMN